MSIRWMAILVMLCSVTVFSMGRSAPVLAQDTPADGDQPAAEADDSEPASEQPAAEEAKTEEPAAEEPKTEEPAVKEEAKEEPAEEKPADEPAKTEEKPAETEPAPSEQPAAESAEAPADAAAARKQFDATFGEWRALLTRLRELQGEYKSTPPDEREAIVKEYNELLAKGDEMVPKLTTAAEGVFKAEGDKDPQITAFLASAVISASAADDYDTALRVGKTLIDAGVGEPKLLELVGTAAFCVDDFDDAEKYFDQASEAGSLDPRAMADKAEIPEYRKLWADELDRRAAEAAADDLPRVLLSTSKGDIVVELFENEAPNTVANFVKLVQDGFYNGVTFHRVLPGFMAQGGDPSGDGSGGPGYNIKDEVGADYPNHRNHFRGSLSMAKTQAPDSGGSQFFITFRPTPHLNGLHTVFGRVIEGMDVLQKLQRRDPTDPNAPPADRIVEAKVLRKRDHEYVPETLPES